MDLKVGELLKEVQLDYSKTKALDTVISAIRDAIEGIPDQKVGADAAPGFIRDLGVPSDKIEFTFKKPESIQIGGSYSIKSVSKPNSHIDLLLRMPKECFHEKDYLNHRYHAKRCLYLCVIKNHLKSFSSLRKIDWSTFQDEARKPVLIVYPDVEPVELFGLFIRIIPMAPPSLFTISKLSLTRNNVRAATQGSIPLSTPAYNSSILEDMFLEENEMYVRKIFLGWKDLCEALVLLKVWARNRGSLHTPDCLNGFLISVIMAYLTTESGGNRINRSMKAVQIFRVTLGFMANSRLWNKGISLQPLGQCGVSKEERRQALQSFGAVVYDSSGHFNLAFRMPKNALLELQDESAWTLNCMDKCGDCGFEEVFMTKVDFPAKFDYCIRISLKKNNTVSASGFCLDNECWRIYEEKVHSLLEQALTDRAKFVRVSWRKAPSEWNIEDGFSKFGNEPLLAGILASSCEKSFRVVDVGPNAENKEEVIKFRKFWGEKAELRRFKDGTIAESTVWECEQWERHLIIKRIAEYVLSKHLSLLKEDMLHVSDQLDFCLLNGVEDSISFSEGLLGAFGVLSKRLRNLEDIPLRISSVQPLDSAFRYASVFPPEPHPLANEKGVGQRSRKFISTSTQSLEVMIQLEGSGNWPLDEVAVEKVKSAFLLKIGESLQNRWGMGCTATEDEVNVLMSGYAFRLRIMHERGLRLLDKLVVSGSDEKNRIFSTDKELFLRGQHSSMINGLQGRYPTYGPVVRLAKRWVASHLFSAFLAEEAIELLVAYLFSNSYPFYAPCSRITGFLRFLRLLLNYDWTFSPLIVDINNDLTSKDKEEINEKFILSRKFNEENGQNVDPAIFLATPYDKTSEAWTKISPNSSVLRRMVSYARSSEELLTNLILQGQTDSHKWESLFRTPLKNYDAVILLHSDRLSYPHRLLFPAVMSQGRHVVQGDASDDFQPYMSVRDLREKLEEERNKLMVNFDPTRSFVEELKREFAGMFKVWYDSLGGDVIGLTWEKPMSKKRGREAASEPTVEMLKEIGEVGKGLVKSINLLKAPRLLN